MKINKYIIISIITCDGLNKQNHHDVISIMMSDDGVVIMVFSNIMMRIIKNKIVINLFHSLER